MRTLELGKASVPEDEGSSLPGLSVTQSSKQNGALIEQKKLSMPKFIYSNVILFLFSHSDLSLTLLNGWFALHLFVVISGNSKS